ncbi:MAG: glycosyltransferase [Actinomycetota bacterium]|nr:glycosyltransferase [Actinomycetota bacterium]MDQ3708253.1 glycosyltransferase [Actinomycetota bacterium]
MTFLESDTLSVCIPTCQRPLLFERALRSVVGTDAASMVETEIVVSDDSSDDATAAVYERVASPWRGRRQYARAGAGGPARNFNRCRELAAGRWILILHDDDYLLPGAVSGMLNAIRSAGDRCTLLFGVHVVDGDGTVLRRQRFRRPRDLPPADAFERVLSHSSYVRFPAIVVRRDAYEAVGPFDTEVGGATDLDMWIRLFARFGVRCLPVTTCAYTVHPGTITEDMFNAATVTILMGIFDRARGLGVLSPRRLRSAQVDFFHQFILAGAWRRLRAGDRAGAGQVLSLFELPSVRRLGVSRRWAPIRVALTGWVHAPRRLLF